MTYFKYVKKGNAFGIFFTAALNKCIFCYVDSSGTGVLMVLKTTEKVNLEQGMAQTASLHQGKGAGQEGVT